MTGITRRDFVNGLAVSVAVGLPSLPAAGTADDAPVAAAPASYPPARDGLRGAAPGTYDVAHALRDGQRFRASGAVDESVDLVVVGAGLGGLSAAYFYARRRPQARILLLDALDDFGGHAQRVEFAVGGRRLISYGGSESMQSPRALYGEAARGLLRDLGVDLERFHTAFDRTLYPDLGLSRGVFFTREAFGRDVLVSGDPQRMVADDIPPDRMNARPIEAFLADFPVSEASRRQLLAIHTSTRDPLAGRSLGEKRAVLERTSYRDWLMRHWSASAEAANTFQNRTLDFFALGADRVPAAWVASIGYPGFAGLGLPVDPQAQAEFEEPYIYHFPDGNASLARMMVRALMPGVAPGRGMEDIVTAPFDYGRLDAPGALVRLRLGSTATSVRNVGRGAGASVEVDYVRDGRVSTVRARHAILAAYHSMAPYVVPELAPQQRAALAANVRAPLVYVKVAVRHWRPWVERGVHEVTNAMGFYARLKLDYPVSLGGHEFPRSPDQPMVLHLVHVPTVATAGLDQDARFRAARAALYARTFGEFEHAARDELTRMFGPAGFDFERDVSALSVHRWGHGYSGFANPLDGDREAPVEAARVRLGRIAFAGSDAAGEAYAHAAFEEAARAVGELL